MRTRPDLALAECFALVMLATVAEAQVPLSQPRVPAVASRSGGATAEFAAEPQVLRSRLEWVGGRPPIAFRPFDTLDAQGRRQPLDSVITLRFPSGRVSRPMTLRDVHFFANQFESDLNAHGFSLRRPDSSTALLRPRSNTALLRRQRQRFDAVPRLTRSSDLLPAPERMQRLQQRIAVPPAQLAQVDPRLARQAATAAPVRARPVAARASGVSPAVDAMVDQFAEVTQSTMVADTTWRWDESFGDAASATVGAGVTMISSPEAVQIAYSSNARAAFLDAQAPLIAVDATYRSVRDGQATATVTVSLLGIPYEPVESTIVPGAVDSGTYGGVPNTNSLFTLDVPLLPVQVDVTLTSSARFRTAMIASPQFVSGWVETVAWARVDADLDLTIDFPPAEIEADGYLMLVNSTQYADLENAVNVSASSACTAGQLCNRFDYRALWTARVSENLSALQGRIRVYLSVPLPCLELSLVCWTRVLSASYGWEPLVFNRPELFPLADTVLVGQDVPLRVQRGAVEAGQPVPAVRRP